MTQRKTKTPSTKAKTTGARTTGVASARERVKAAIEGKLGVAPRGGRGRKIDVATVAADDLPFWRRKTLGQMTMREWESLCDGCGKCCVHKLEYESGEVVQTTVCCELLDTHHCNCRDYPNRKAVVPDCIQLTPGVVAEMDWLPSTCAYRLVLQGKDLQWWHPLVSGDPQTVHQAGISARDKVISEKEVDDHEKYVIDREL